LVGHLVESSEQLLPYALEIAKHFEACSPAAVKTTKQLLAKCASRSLESSLNEAVIVNSKARKSSDCEEGVSAFLEKRPPNWVPKEKI
jgi:enoyl-CoA hydratase/carnithine racemase